MVPGAPARNVLLQESVAALTQWWHEHANLCLVAASVSGHDQETRARFRLLMDESVSRGENLLAKVLEYIEPHRRNMATSAETVTAFEADNAKSSAQVSRMPLSGMNRFCETVAASVNGSVRIVSPAPCETPPKELLPSRKYTKKTA